MGDTFKGTISELSKASGLPIETIRFYQRRGILGVPNTRGRERRQYRQDALERLNYIRAAKALGFTLKEIADTLELTVKEGRTCRSVRDLVDHKLNEVRQQIAMLHDTEKQLETIAKSCSGLDRNFEACEIIEKMRAATDPKCWSHDYDGGKSNGGSGGCGSGGCGGGGCGG